MAGKSYEDLIVWKESMKLAQEVYVLTRLLPSEEKYGLMQQMRRSAVSISSNIAEGSGRNHLAEFYQFLGIASGSLAELKTQLLITSNIFESLQAKIVPVLAKLDEVGKMLSGLKRNISEQKDRCKTLPFTNQQLATSN